MTSHVTSHVYKRATEPGLPAGMIYTHSMEETFDMVKGHTSRNLTSVYFHNFWFYVEIMTQHVNFPIGPV